ncbi:MAG: hypothetical protein IPL28_02085 [Chloroflexi bacterium]|nr:hypothetical protein [Chloroflexota bacterium]
MNNTKLINTLAAVSLTILILVVAVGFGWRQGDETAAELESTGTVGSAASAEGGDAFAAPAELMAKQALEAQLTQMNATIEVMQAREAEFQAQIETANGLLANSGGAGGTDPDPILTQQMADLQANLAIMQQREAEYRAQLELANQRLQAQATAVTQAQSAAAPATSFTAQDDDEDEGDEYENEGGEHEDEGEDDHDDDHDDDHGDDDDEDGDDD